jgi:hypothetical protein
MVSNVMIERLWGAMISCSGTQIKEKNWVPARSPACGQEFYWTTNRVDRNFIERYSEERDMHGEEQRHAWNQDMRGRSHATRDAGWFFSSATCRPSSLGAHGWFNGPIVHPIFFFINQTHETLCMCQAALARSELRVRNGFSFSDKSTVGRPCWGTVAEVVETICNKDEEISKMK